MNSFGIDDKEFVASFERKVSGSGNFYWQDIGDKYPHPECDPHDVAWVVSILYSVTTKSLKQVFEAPKFKLDNQQIKALIEKYTRIYVNELDRTENPQLARRTANTMLTNAAINFSSR